MTVSPHPKYSEVLAAIKSLLPHSKLMTGVWYRCVETSFAHELISGEGARIHGGRWNPLGSFCAVYLSGSPETALQEYLARSRRMKWPDHQSLPMVMAGVVVKASRVLDTTNPSIAKLLEVFLKSEKAHWRSIQSQREAASQALGRAARAAGIQGIIYLSQQIPRGKNIVLFPDQLGPRDRLTAPKLQVVIGSIS